MAEIITGQRRTYGYVAPPGAAGWDSINEALDISPALDMLRPVDVPLLTLIGRSSLRDPVDQVKHEWYEDEYRLMSATASAAVTAANLSSVTVTPTGAGNAFRGTNGATGGAYDATHIQPGDIVRMSSSAGDEIGIVTGVVGDVLAIDRDQLGSTPLGHTVAPVIQIIGTLQPQGLTTVGTSRTTVKTGLFNYCQIFEDSFRASATQQVTRKWTAQNDRAREMSKIMDLMGVQFERTLLHGRKQKPYPTAATQQGPAGAMGGIRSFITTNVYNKATVQLTQNFLEDALQAVWEAGATASHAFVNATQKRVINTFMDAERRVDYRDTRLGNTIETYATDFGNVSFVLDRHMPIDEVLIIDASKIGFGPMNGRQLQMSKRPVESSEADLWQIVGEYTCEVRLEKSHARIWNLKTTIP